MVGAWRGTCRKLSTVVLNISLHVSRPELIYDFTATYDSAFRCSDLLDQHSKHAAYPHHGAAQASRVHPRSVRRPHLRQRHNQRHARYIHRFDTLANLTVLLPGILHTIFFHRYFPSIRPSSIEVLDLTLPTITDVELETLINTRTTALIRQLSSTTSPNSSVRGQIAVQFFEKKRRRGGLGWFGGGKAEEEVCWEVWMLEITLATPRTEAGK